MYNIQLLIQLLQHLLIYAEYIPEVTIRALLYLFLKSQHFIYVKISVFD